LLGDDHPNTIWWLNNLAEVRSQTASSQALSATIRTRSAKPNSIGDRCLRA